MENYRNNLRHVVRPEERNERNSSPSVQLTDYEALYLARALNDYAFYKAADERAQEIALAYTEYIEMVVREERKATVNIYAHTPRAREVLADAVDAHQNYEHDLHGSVSSPIHGLWSEDDGGG